MAEAKKVLPAFIKRKLKAIDPKSHKGTFGHALIIGGSHGKIGAVSLSSKAALRTGCGLVTAYIPECGYEILQAAVPEVMVITNTAKNLISEIKFDVIPQAIGIGPGMGQDQPTQKALRDFLKSNNIPLVIDADALNILAKNQSWLKFLPKNTILTPHEIELERLIGNWKDDNEKFAKVLSFALKYSVIMVLKGAPTFITDGIQILQNTTGNAALATAGSGDVLTGMITSLQAQHYSPLDAAVIGVYLHGLTADIAVAASGRHSFIASDIIENIGKAYLSIENGT